VSPEWPAGDVPAPSRATVEHLGPDEVELLRTVLRAGDVPFGIVNGEVIAAPGHEEELNRAIAWVRMEHYVDDIAEDPEYQSDKPPLVQPSRVPLADGRRMATRWRRLVAGLIDQLLVGVPTALAIGAGAAPWTVITIHFVYFVAPTALFGWSIAKFWCGLRVVDRRTLRTPAWHWTAIRWFVAYLPVAAAQLFHHADSLAWIIVMAPVLVDLKGLHDRAAHTLVVERSVAGPRRFHLRADGGGQRFFA
jgi:uncharacterized RDD family membrane protein YckC